MTGWIQEEDGAVHTLSRQILGLAQVPILCIETVVQWYSSAVVLTPSVALKQVAPKGRLVPLHIELLLVELVHS